NTLRGRRSRSRCGSGMRNSICLQENDSVREGALTQSAVTRCNGQFSADRSFEIDVIVDGQVVLNGEVGNGLGGCGRNGWLDRYGKLFKIMPENAYIRPIGCALGEER